MEHLVNGKKFKDLKEAQDYELKIEEERREKEKLKKEKTKRISEIEKLVKKFNEDYEDETRLEFVCINYGDYNKFDGDLFSKYFGFKII